MKAMETIHDLIEEAKLRTVYWVLFIFAVTYFLSHTSSSMWMNLPLSILLVSTLRILSNEVDFRWKSSKPNWPLSYLSHLEKKQLSVNDSRLNSTPIAPRWKRKIDSPIVDAAANEFIDKILKDFVVDLWYSEITPDKEAPELMRAVIMDAIGEISGRVKEINLVDLLTRDIVDLIGDHLELFRRNQAAIGVDVMATLSTEQRDERLKHHLMSSKELHPALISPESEYKVLQRLVGGVLAVVLRPRESQCPLVRVIARELVTCLILQPVMNLASPGYINELIEYILLGLIDGTLMSAMGVQSTGDMDKGDSTSSNYSSLNIPRTDNFDDTKNSRGTDLALARIENHSLGDNSCQQESIQPPHAEWARMLEAATQRRTEVLMPENLENMWTKGRNYKKKENKNIKSGIQVQQSVAKVSGTNSKTPTINMGKERLSSSALISRGTEEKDSMWPTPQLSLNTSSGDEKKHLRKSSVDFDEKLPLEGAHGDEFETSSNHFVNEKRSRLKRSNSTSDLKIQPDKKVASTGKGEGPIISEFYSAEFGRRSENGASKNVSDIVLRCEGPHFPKLKCRVMGAYFEKLSSKSFAVYSIAVTDAENRTWFVKRRYRNFERLHRQLKEIPNYKLHLPPKRIFSSSTEDAFVHQRCIQLDRYLQDLLSIANVAEQHEVWDFLSVSSKNYSFGKSSSVMRTLAVNVDDAVDDIVRQFKGVSDGLMRKVVGSPALLDGNSSAIHSRHLSWNADEISKPVLRQDTSDTLNSISDNEDCHHQDSHGQEEVGSSDQSKGWHSDNELNPKDLPPRVINYEEESRSIGSEKKHASEMTSLLTPNSSPMDDPIAVPPEWTPPNVSVPLLNLVDKVFQLKKRGWLRRQVFWISKQILQLIMEDAIDDWLLRQIYWLRREETVALGIQWLQDVLWPDGTFFTRIGVDQSKADAPLSLIPFQISQQFGGSNASKQGTFEEQLEAARRASNIKKLLFDGAPTALVSLIGQRQYKRCARDIFYFTQSTICIKQLGYGILELLLLSVFPELRDLFLDLHEKMRAPPA